MTPLITLYTAPKPFNDPHIAVIQRNTLLNWLALGEDVEVVVIGDDPGIAEICQELHIQQLPDVRSNDLGTPLISSIFEMAREVNDSPFLAYGNADILFLPDLLAAVKHLAEKKEQFLAVGQRWDVDVKEPINFGLGWETRLHERVKCEGKLHGQTGSDYFIYPRTCFREIPDFAVGRAGWDNWMIFKARWENLSVIDLSDTVKVLHQNHDYGHLPGGIVHYHLPETDLNVRIGGGRRTIFTLQDVTHVITDHGLAKKPLNWKTFWREVEIFPLIRMHSRPLGWLSFALFHPVKAFNEVRGWLAYKFAKR